MLGKLHAHMTYANVMSTLAVFLALAGGIAWALGRNDVKSRHIAPNQVKAADTSDALRLECPPDTRYHEGACIETAFRTGLGRTAAFAVCDPLDGRLPSVAELQNFAREPGIEIDPNGEWTSDYAGAGVGVLVLGSSSVFTDNEADTYGYRCVFPAKR